MIELQRKALSTDISVSNLLRTAYVVARKLKIESFEQWIDSELNGYIRKETPEYRNTRPGIVAFNPYRGYMPVHFPEMDYPIRNSVPELESLLENSKKGTVISKLSYEQQRLMMEHTGVEYEFSFEIPMNILKSVLETVRNLILDWSLKLEETGIVGEELSFSLEEVEKAKDESVSNVNNFITIYGNMNNSQIGQGTRSSVQDMR